MRPEFLISVHTEDPGNEGIRGHRAFFDLCSDTGIVDMVEQLIGPDIVLWACQIFGKRAKDGLEIPWHQDGAYWPIRPLATCTAWVALDDSKPENGCLRVLPGYHRARELLPHRACEREGVGLNQELDPGAYDEADATDIVLKAGQLSFHDVFMPHGSHANRSERPRMGVAIRYMPATSLYDRSLAEPPRTPVPGYRVDLANRPIFLLRGSDRHGGNDFIRRQSLLRPKGRLSHGAVAWFVRFLPARRHESSLQYNGYVIVISCLCQRELERNTHGSQMGR